MHSFRMTGRFESALSLFAVMQYGYVTLFVVAFPLVPLLAFVSDYIEIRVDSIKVCRCRACKRARVTSMLLLWAK